MNPSKRFDRNNKLLKKMTSNPPVQCLLCQEEMIIEKIDVSKNLTPLYSLGSNKIHSLMEDQEIMVQLRCPSCGSSAIGKGKTIDLSYNLNKELEIEVKDIQVLDTELSICGQNFNSDKEGINPSRRDN